MKTVGESTAPVEGNNYTTEGTSKLEIENRLKESALDGLCNLYHAITGQHCERYVSLGMATSAVSTLINERDGLRAENERLRAEVSLERDYSSNLREQVEKDKFTIGHLAHDGRNVAELRARVAELESVQLSRRQLQN